MLALPPPPPCVPSGAKVVSVQGRAAVYSKGGPGRFGCYGAGKPVTLLPDTIVNAGLRRITLKGRFVAFVLESGGLDTGSAGVEVYDLKRRRRTENHGAIRHITGPEFIESVTALRLRSDGAVAWIARGQSLGVPGGASATTAPPPRPPQAREVHGARRGRDHLLATGSDISLRTLSLRGRLVVWRQAGAAKTARL
jgi:hypothetical protein